MKVLITGIAGFVGSHLVDYILTNHPEVELCGLDLHGASLDNISHLPTRVKLYRANLIVPSQVRYILDGSTPDVIFHLAAQPFVSESYRDPKTALATNAIGTINLLEQIRLLYQDPVIVICSSPEIYGNQQDERPLTEDSPLRPVNPYALSKVTEDLAGFMYFQAYMLRIIVSRGFAHEGPRRGEDYALSSFARQIAAIEAGIQDPAVKVGNLRAIRVYCDVRDMVRAYWMLAEKGTPGEAYNIMGDEKMTVGEALQKLLDLSPCKERIRVEIDPTRLRPADVTHQVGDDSKFRKLTGWKPAIPFAKKTLPDLLEYWRAFYGS